MRLDLTERNTAAILALAVEVAHAAGALVREGFGRPHQVTLKGVVDPVTETDTASEALIVGRLRAAMPGCRILAEENGGDAWQTPEPIWLVDPLDGTVNFAHGFPQVCVSLGLVVAGLPLVGVIYDPLRDETFAARQGGGATCNGQPIHVAPTPRLAQALLATGFPYDRRTAADNNTRRLDHFLRRAQGIRRAGSAALDLAYVAAGRLDGYWEMRLKPWDMAAGLLLVTEAGGRVSDYAGGSEMLARAHVVASNGLIHDEMLRVIREGDAAPHPDFPSALG